MLGGEERLRAVVLNPQPWTQTLDIGREDIHRDYMPLFPTKPQ